MNTHCKFVVVGLLVAQLMFLGACKDRLDQEEEEGQAQTNKRPAIISWENGQAVLTIDTATQNRLGLGTETLTTSVTRPEITAPAVVLSVLDLTSSRNSYIASQTQLQKASVEADVADKEYSRLKALFGENQNISEKALQLAEGASKARDADVRAAEQQLSLQESAIRQEWGTAVTTWVIEGSAELQHILDQREVFVQMTLPASASLRPPKSISLEVPGGARTLATFVSSLPRVDSRIQGSSFLYLGSAHSRLAPGVNLLAHLSIGNPISGVIVPSAAVVWSEGKAWVYQKTAPDRFVQRAIETGSKLEKGFLVASGLKAGDEVVTQGAQALLSEELMHGGGAADVD